tara:strand:- start:567 stop:1088 length:522 start_codon:yes stop_codon:yes gene_type:complete
MNGIILSILLTIIVLIGNIFFNNYFLIKYIKNVSGLLLSISSILITSFLLGVIISIYASKKNCKKTNKMNAIRMGIKSCIYSIIGYFLVYFVSFIREPFLSIIGNNELGYSVAQSFIIVLNSITATIINYYTSIKMSCNVTNSKKVEENLRKLDKYLDEKPKENTNIKSSRKE